MVDMAPKAGYTSRAFYVCGFQANLDGIRLGNARLGNTRLDMKEITELSFEEAFAELEVTVSRLERGDLSLEESIVLFERGQALASRCNVQLDVAELKVRQLLPGDEGEAVPFEMEQD